MSTYKEITSNLNEVLTRNYDAIEGYRNAADNIGSPALKSFFNDQVAERTRFAVELSSEIVRLGEQPVSEGSTKAALHRTWMDMKSAVASNNEEAVIEECIRGEQAACAEYKELLHSELPIKGNLNNVLKSHKEQIERSINHLKTMETIV